MGSGQNGSITKKGVFWFGSEQVRVETGPGQNGFRVGSGWLKIAFFKKKRDCTSRGLCTN
ncbi:hypothetical protein HanPSC8_Chr15g0674501 [Helianthus annuus]|nr:hypothetical protein HanPSC8_Chr15g0674501 [Helianthus annuus]